jgi:hypothetical protein
MRLCNTAEELVHLAYDHLDTISPRGIAAFWSLLVKHVQNHRGGNSRVQLNEQLAEILCNTLENMKSYSYRDISTVAISLSKIMKQVESRGQREATGSLHRIIHNLLIGGDNSENKHFIFSKIAVYATPILSNFDARSLSNLIYSFGYAECDPKVEDGHSIMDTLALEAMSKLHHFNSQDLSNMLWSYAKLGTSNSVLFKTAGDLIVGMNVLEEFKQQELANIVWSYATAGMSHPKLYKKLSDHIVSMKDLNRFDSQALSNIIWAYATAEESHPQLFSKLGDHIVAMKDLGLFKPQALSNIVWSFSTAGKSHPKLFSKVGDHIVAMNDFSSFLPQHFSNILWAFATAGKSHPLLYNKLANHIVAMKDLSSFLPQELYNIAWSYAVANVNDPSLFNTNFVAALQAKADDFGLTQLYQWQLWQDELKSGINLPSALCEQCRKAFLSRLPEPSRLQDDVIYVLSSIGMSPEEEILTHSGYRLDAIVKVNGEKVGIEVDGPSHFINREATGSTLLKRRQVNNLDGIKIVSVPYWEWDEFGKDRAKKQDYLLSKLDLNNIPIISVPDCDWIKVRKGRARSSSSCVQAVLEPIAR